MRDSTELLGRPRELRDRYQQDGYVLLRGILDPVEVMRIRGAYFSLFPEGYLRPGTAPAAGVYSGQTAPAMPHGVAGHPAHTFVRSAEYARFAEAPRLAELAEVLLDGPVALLPRKVLRHFDRESKQASRAHVDRAYPSGGDMVTAWITLGDCPIDRGGVIYLSDSQRLPAEAGDLERSVTDRPYDPRPISHDLAWTARTVGGRWLWTDFRVGDVALHCPDLIHASLDNTTDIARLSTDLRFQRAEEPVDPRWAVPWAADDGA
ncbi:phytanoyl-CoA dioxygenase family protein [Catenulispora sp. GP43]|uniref:phytanoyl-CoA dioxygenase family protein n=1 Tax=Catenulispora sp. GP43 TaxID=3156263 RepID=UPI003517D22C